MPKVSLYLDENLAERVRALKIPLSAVSQGALRQSVAVAEAMAAASTEVERVAVRLRASKQEHWETRRADGVAIGIVWARNAASYSDLQALLADDWDEWCGRQLLDFVAQHDGDFATLVRTDPFTDGLVEGARSVWQAVAHLVDGPAEAGGPSPHDHAGRPHGPDDTDVFDVEPDEDDLANELREERLYNQWVEEGRP